MLVKAEPASSLGTLANGALLERVAVALNSTLELREVLRLLAEITLDAAGAERCSVFLLEDRRLHPAVSLGTRTDESLWTTFQSMSPVTLDSRQWLLLNRGEVLPIEDVNESEVIPEEWIERFELGALVAIPLLAAGDPCGLMVVDWSNTRSFARSELQVLEAIGSYAGVAVRNARLYEEVRGREKLNEALAKGASALATHAEPSRIADRLAGAYSELLGAKLCAIGIFDSERTQITTIASRGTYPIGQPLQIPSIPERIVSRLWKEWTVEKRPIRFDEEPWFADFVGGTKAGATWYLVIPLVAEGRSRGVVLLGFDRRTELAGEEMSAAEGLAAMAGAALERAMLLDRLARQLNQLDALYRLSTSLSEGRDAIGLVREVNELVHGQGIEVVGIKFTNRNLTNFFRKSNHQTPSDNDLAEGILGVPMRIGRKSFGTLSVRPSDLDAQQLSFIEALGRGIAEFAMRAALRSAMEEATRERAIVEERERIGSDLHDTAGQILVSIGLLSRRLSEQLPPDSPWAEKILRLANLADSGKWQIDQAIRALAFVPAARRGLVPSLRALARSFASDSGIPVVADVDGKPSRLGSRVEQALYRVAHEALGNAWRHSRCSLIRLELVYSSADITLRVVDDGIGMMTSQARADSARRGLVNMRRTMQDIGGSLRIRNAKPRGLQVEAKVPRRPQRS